MAKLNFGKIRRLKRKDRCRQRISGTPERPRLTVYRSARHIYAQLIDDTKGATLVSASSMDKELKAQKGATLATAKEVGGLLARRAKLKNLASAVFDRNGFLYHGQLKVLADAAREGGLKF